MQARAETQWRWWLLGVSALAIVIRVVYVVGWHTYDEALGDHIYYHLGANLLAEGKGYVHPYLWTFGINTPGADHPPAYQTVLAMPSLLGFDGIRDHQLFSCLIGGGTVGLVGLLGRRLGGPRVGLIAAGLAAVYPLMWLWDGALLAEPLAMLLAAGTSLAAYRVWEQPRLGRFAVLGVLIGLCALTRSEGVMLLGVLVVPLALWTKGLAGARARAGRIGIAIVAAVLTLAPWSVANLMRFDQPVLLSAQAGFTLAAGNCPETYAGKLVGSWSLECAARFGVYSESGEGGILAFSEAQHEGSVEHIRANLDQLPGVAGARFGRVWSLYQPFQDVSRQTDLGALESVPGHAGVWMYSGLVAFGVGGLVALRRLGVPSFPLTAWMVVVSISAIVFLGELRYRATAEPALVVLAAVGIDALVRRFRPTDLASA